MPHWLVTLINSLFGRKLLLCVDRCVTLIILSLVLSAAVITHSRPSSFVDIIVFVYSHSWWATISLDNAHILRVKFPRNQFLALNVSLLVLFKETENGCSTGLSLALWQWGQTDLPVSLTALWMALETWSHVGHASSPPQLNPMAPVTTSGSWWYNRDVTVVGPGMRASHRAVFLIKRESCF